MHTSKEKLTARARLKGWKWPRTHKSFHMLMLIKTCHRIKPDEISVCSLQCFRALEQAKQNAGSPADLSWKSVPGEHSPPPVLPVPPASLWGGNVLAQGVSSSNWTQLLMAEARSGGGCSGLRGGEAASEMRPIFSEESSCSEGERSWEPPSTTRFSPEEISDWSEEDDGPGRCSSVPPETDTRKYHHIMRGRPLFRTVSWRKNKGQASSDQRTHHYRVWGQKNIHAHLPLCLKSVYLKMYKNYTLGCP